MRLDPSLRSGHGPLRNFVSRQGLANPILLALFLSASLAIGFIPTTSYLAKTISNPSLQRWLQTLLFPALSALFFVSGNGGKRTAILWLNLLRQCKSVPLPCAIALVSGIFINQTPISFLFPQKLVWYLLAVPIGEELLFRGWIFGVYQTFYGEKPPTRTNPLPLTVWMSALCFALWHAQNIPTDGLVFGVFQVVYTFFVGLWLGRLRWLYGAITPPILAHIFLNISGSLLQ